MSATETTLLIYEAIDRSTGTIHRIGQEHSTLISSITSGVLRAQVIMGGLSMAYRGFSAVARAAIGEVKHGMIDLNGTAQQTQYRIASMLNAFGVQSGWDNSMNKAKQLHKILETMAGPLPGEAQDYLKSFSTSIGALIGSFNAKGVSSTTEMARFSAMWSAVATSNQVEPPQIGMDLQRLLQGQAIRQMQTVKNMSPLFQLALGHKFSTKEWNKMDDVGRLDILQKIVEKQKEFIGMVGVTNAAQAGAIATMRTQFSRAATHEGFEWYLNLQRKIIAYYEKHTESVGHLADVISDRLLWALQKVESVSKRAFGWIIDNKDRMSNTFTEWGIKAQDMGNGIMRGVDYMRDAFGNNGLGLVGNITMAQGVAAGALAGNPAGMAIAATVGGVIQGGMETKGAAEAPGRLLEALASLYEAVEPVLQPFIDLGRIVGAIVVEMGPNLVHAGAEIIRLITTTLMSPVTIFLGLFNGSVGDLQDTAHNAGTALGDFAWMVHQANESLTGMINWIKEVMPSATPTDMDSAILETAEKASRLYHNTVLQARISGNASDNGVMKAGYLVKEGWAGLLGYGADALSGTQRMFGADTSANVAMSRKNEALAYAEKKAKFMRDQMPVPNSSPFAQMWEKLHSVGIGVPDDKAIGNPEGKTDATQRVRSYYDFRNSKFDITQKFDAGFDPDRLAATFMTDLESAAEQSLSSKFAPNYSKW